MSATNLNIRTDKDVKEQAEQLFAELGLNMTTAINLFLRTAIRKHGIPFDLYLDVPNETTVAAIEEGKKLLNDPSSPIDKLYAVIETLAEGNTLDPKFKDHELTGNYKGTRECHIEPDWLLIYEIQNDVLVLMLSRLGSHSELFKK